MMIKWLNLVLWLGAGIITLISDSDDIRYYKISYGCIWFVLLVNLLARALGV